MSDRPNTLVWDHKPGHYEVYYVSLTDPASGCGAWIRYTMLAPLPETGEEATCSLWFMAMDPQSGVLGRKANFPIAALSAREQPFELRIGESVLTDSGMSGGFEEVAWDLSWTPTAHAYEHVHPILRRARIAKTVLCLPHADLAIEGTLRFGDRTLELAGARGGQAHLFGSKHASRWAWAHCNDFHGLDGEPRPDSFIDGVSVVVPRFGREVGPSTPIVGRVLGEDFLATSPRSVLAAPSHFALSTWRFGATSGRRRIVGQVDAPRAQMVGVTYTDPDGDHAYCYNSEVASMRLWIWERPQKGSWTLADTLVSDGRAHFEYAQREPVPGLELQIR